MAVKTPAELKTDMPVGIVNAVDVLDIHNIVDSFEDRTTQDLSTKTATYLGVLTDNRRKIVFNAAAGVTFTVPSDAPTGWECGVIQMGAGQVTISAGGGSLFCRAGHTKTAGQYAICYVVVVSNAGTAPQVYLGGDTGT